MSECGMGDSKTHAIELLTSSFRKQQFRRLSRIFRLIIRRFFGDRRFFGELWVARKFLRRIELPRARSDTSTFRLGYGTLGSVERSELIPRFRLR